VNPAVVQAAPAPSAWPHPALPPALDAPPAPQAATRPPDAGADEPIFDPDKLMAAVGGKPETRAVLVAMVRNMVDTGLQPIRDAQQALDENRPRDAGRIFHTMRGSLGTLGAKRLVRVCHALEQALKHPAPEHDIPVLLAAVAHELGALNDAARDWLQLQEAGQKVLGPQDIGPQDVGSTAPQAAGLDVLALRALQEELQSRNMRACDHYDHLRPALARCFDPAQMARMDEAMTSLQFEPVLAVLQPLLQGAAQLPLDKPTRPT
jgi:HPt (histidine-containing phosphotransfer) domain-containing protein